jgi:hypothetical protein
LSEKENLFLRNLRSNLSGADMQKTLELYKARKPIDDKNVFLNRIIKANPNAFKESCKKKSICKKRKFYDATASEFIA